MKTFDKKMLLTVALLSGLLIIATAGCDSSNNSNGDSQAADAANLQTEAVSTYGEIPKPANLVFKDANVITMTGETILRSKSVFVSKGVITAIGDFNTLSFPADAIIIDAAGRYLAPGYSDMHVHISNSNPEQDSKLFLANGVTIVRNMWGFPIHLALRERISRREVPGPELFTAGPLFDGEGSFIGGSFKLTDATKVEAAIRKVKEDGYDYIKVYNYLKRDVYDEIFRVAREINIPVVGHIPYDVGVFHVIDSGQQSIEHFWGYIEPGSKDYDDQIEQTLQSGIWNCPTLIVLKSYGNIKEAKARVAQQLKYVDAGTINEWGSQTDLPIGFSWKKTLLKKLYDGGANIVSGSDVNNPFVIAGFSLLDEFELMNEAGLTPYQVLRTTTIDPARMLGIEDRVGTIEPGKDADLVLLERNPLENISNTRTIAGVMTKGTWLPKEALQKMLDEVEESFSKKSDAVPKEISVAPEMLTQYVGTYELEPDLNITVTLEGGRLITQATGQEKIPVYAMSETKFSNKMEDATVEFFKDDKGAVSHFIRREGRIESIAAKTGFKKGPATGTWIATADGPDGNPLEATYKFEAIGKTLIGTISTRMGGGPFSEGKIDGDTISFVVSYGNTYIEWTGTVSGDEINFTQRNGEEVKQFTAKRVGK